jgi:hypothetical protein
MVLEGFSERRGARPVSNDVSRVAIVITDGRYFLQLNNFINNL